MALTQHKITDYKGLDIASLPDKLTGTAAENKAAFDRTVKQVVAVSLNGLIQELEDLGADSANLMMLIMDLETEFNLTVEDEALGSIKTVGDIVDYIQKKG